MYRLFGLCRSNSGKQYDGVYLGQSIHTEILHCQSSFQIQGVDRGVSIKLYKMMKRQLLGRIHGRGFQSVRQ